MDRERFRAPVRLGHHYCTCIAGGYCYSYDELFVVVAEAAAVGNVSVEVVETVAVEGDS